jgi:hypothetical protein
METEIAAKALEQFQEKCEAVFPGKARNAFPRGIASKQEDRAVRRSFETMNRSRLCAQFVKTRMARSTGTAELKMVSVSGEW